MSTHTKLMIANVLMSIGVAPLAFCVVWLTGLLSWISGYRAIIPIGDPLSMLGPFVLSFLFTAAVAGTSAAWSWDLARANPQCRSQVALGLRLMTAILLISPFALILLTRFFNRKPSQQRLQRVDTETTTLSAARKARPAAAPVRAPRAPGRRHRPPRSRIHCSCSAAGR